MSETMAVTSARAPWRGIITEYRDRLPVTAGMPAVTLQEGGTPLLPAPVLSARTGCDVYLKVEGLNPTGSFKDRGMTTAITVAAAQGAKVVICASTGQHLRVRRRLRGAGGPDLRRPRAQGQDRDRQARPGARARREAAAGRRVVRRLP